MKGKLSSERLFALKPPAYSILAILSFIIALSISDALASNAISVVFGPKQYTRTTGNPNHFLDAFQAAAGSATIEIRNGSATGGDRVTSAVIYLNGRQIFSPSDFKQSAYNLKKPVVLNNGTNILETELRSKPGSYLSIIANAVNARTIDITIASPSDGATVIGSNVMVTGTVTNSAGVETGVTVNGTIAAVSSNNEFAANHVPLTEGTNTITVRATDATGTTATKTVTVNAIKANSYIELSAYPDSGAAPLEVTLRINGSFNISNPVITPSGPGATERLQSTNPDEYKYRIISAGIYYFTIQAVGPDSNMYQDSIAVTVLPYAQLDSLLKAKWEGMKSALLIGDLETAVSYFAEGSQDRYRAIFLELSSKGKLNSIFSNITEMRLSRLYEYYASCSATRIETGGIYSYPVSFVQDGNGIWRIRGF